MSRLLRNERYRQIRRLIDEKGLATVADLSTKFDVSTATIRRDLQEMEKLGWIQRDHGGAISVDPVSTEPPLSQRGREEAAEKQAIGYAAARLVKPGETIFIGAGTTTVQMARNLEGIENLTVITNALTIANAVANQPEITLIVIGGLLRPLHMSFIGHITEQALKELRADKTFVGIQAVNIHNGLTSSYLPEVMTDRAVMQIASEVILLADHTKFNKVSTSLVAPLNSVQTVVTDDQIEGEIVSQLESLGIRVVIAHRANQA